MFEPYHCSEILINDIFLLSVILLPISFNTLTDDSNVSHERSKMVPSFVFQRTADAFLIPSFDILAVELLALIA